MFSQRTVRAGAMGCSIALLCGVVVLNMAKTTEKIRAGEGKAMQAQNRSFTLQEFASVKPQEFPWGWIRWVINADVDPDAEMTLGVVQINPHQSNYLHVHPDSAEYLHVVSGSCEHLTGDTWVKMRAGDTIRIPKGVPHKARTGDEPCRTIVVYDTGRRTMVNLEEKK